MKKIALTMFAFFCFSTSVQAGVDEWVYACQPDPEPGLIGSIDTDIPDWLVTTVIENPAALDSGPASDEQDAPDVTVIYSQLTMPSPDGDNNNMAIMDDLGDLMSGLDFHSHRVYGKGHIIECTYRGANPMRNLKITAEVEESVSCTALPAGETMEFNCKKVEKKG